MAGEAGFLAENGGWLVEARRVSEGRPRDVPRLRVSLPMSATRRPPSPQPSRGGRGGRGSHRSLREPEGEADHLGIVLVVLDQREREVDRERDLAEEGELDANAGAD